MVPLQGDSGTTLFTATGEKAATDFGNACWFGGQVKHLGTATVEGSIQRRAVAFVLGTHTHDVNLPTATEAEAAGGSLTMEASGGGGYVADLAPASTPVYPAIKVTQINTSYVRFTFAAPATPAASTAATASNSGNG